MSCNILLKDLGYSCYEIGKGVSQLMSPFTRGEDGELVGVYVQEMGDGHFRVSDGGDSLAHMLTHGIRLPAKRTDILQRLAYREGVDLSESTGEIHLSVNESSLVDGVNRVLSMAFEVGYIESNWLTSSRKAVFKDRVGEYLYAAFQDVENDVGVKGLSGHQLEIPFVIHGKDNVTYIETVGRKNDKINWSSAYKVSGVMSDLRDCDVKRCVIIDDLDQLDTQQAEIALSEHAIVLPFSRRAEWFDSVA